MTSQTCLVLNDTLTQDEVDSCARFALRTYGTFDRSVNGLGIMSGANALDVAKIAIDHSLLTYNVSLLTNAYNRVHSEVQIKDGVGADGIRADGSFGQYTFYFSSFEEPRLNGLHRPTRRDPIQRKLWSVHVVFTASMVLTCISRKGLVRLLEFS